jgi:hypothetical protein
MNPSPLLLQARDALCEGDADRVLSLFSSAPPGEDLHAWVLTLIEAGHEQVARAQAERLSPQQKAHVLGLLDDALADTQPVEDDADPFAVADETLRPRAVVDAELVALFLRFYGGRRDVYAKAWYDERRKRAGYHPVEQPLTESVARAHLQGAMTIGQYLLHPDGTCSFGVIDLDLSASIVESLRVTHGDAVSGLAHPPLRELALRLLDAGQRLGLPLFAEDSGGRGVHVWLHLDPRRQAAAVRSLLAQVIVAAGPIPPGVGTEIFPKQERLGPRGLSSLVKLPLGAHPATLRTCSLLDDRLAPIESSLEALRALRVAPTDMVDAVVGRRVVPLPAPELTPTEAVPRLDARPTPRSLAEGLRQVQAGHAEKEAVDAVLRGCPVVAGLVRKAFEEHALMADEARALLYTIGLIGPGPGVIDDVFASARVPRRELDRMRRGLPNPAGCKKLSRLAPPGTCACFPDGKALPYPTPVLHALGSVAPSPPPWAPFAEHLGADERVVQGPLDAIGEALARIEERLARLENKPSGDGLP